MGRLRCAVHVNYYDHTANVIPRNSCMQCWKIHEERMNEMLYRMGWKCSLKLEQLEPEEKAVFGGDAKGVVPPNLRGPKKQQTDQTEPDPMDVLAGVPPITEIEQSQGAQADLPPTFNEAPAGDVEEAQPSQSPQVEASEAPDASPVDETEQLIEDLLREDG